LTPASPPGTAPTRTPGPCGARAGCPTNANFVTPSFPEYLSGHSTFSAAAADQAGISREYGGIHFNDGDFEARQADVDLLVWSKAKSHFNGKAIAKTWPTLAWPGGSRRPGWRGA
jgi:hypothetical protein